MGSAFEGFSQAELLAYTFRTHGERGLREVLDSNPRRQGITDRPRGRAAPHRHGDRRRYH